MAPPRGGSGGSKAKVLIGLLVAFTLFMSYELGRSSVKFTKRDREFSQEYLKEAAKIQNVREEKQKAFNAEAALKKKHDGSRALLQAERKDPLGRTIGPSTFTDAQWEIQQRNQYRLERNISCNNPHADQLVNQGMAAVQMVTHYDYRLTSEQDRLLLEARKAFESAIESEPECQTAHLNLGILLFALKDFQKGLEHLLKAEAAEGPLKKKAVLWKGIYMEQGYPQNDGWNTIYQHYWNLFRDKPEYALEYFAVRSKDILESNPNAALHMLTTESRYTPYGLSCIQRALAKMLLAKEFSTFMGGYAALLPQEARSFPENWYIMIRNMIDPYSLAAMQEFYADMISHGEFEATDPQAKRFVSANDPPARFLMAQFNNLITRLADQLTKPTYTYFGSYYNQSVLHSHRDRRQCEYTLSVNIDINPRQSQCPLGFSKKPRDAPPDYLGHPEPMPPKEERMYVYPRPGDGVLIKGRNIIHWRDQMPAHFNCSQLFLHYANDDFALSLA